MFLLCLKGGQKGRSHFSFSISVRRAACPVIPTSLALPLGNLFYRMVSGDSTFTNRLRRMSKAFPRGVSKLAYEPELNVNAFYRTRSTQGNPELKGPGALLRAIGMQFAIGPLRKRVD
jgi:DNA-binding phage protein